MVSERARRRPALRGARRKGALRSEWPRSRLHSSGGGYGRFPSRCADQILHLSTYYRAEPVRLSLTRLHPSLDWIAIVIEQRSDAGTAAWRAATFGYATWLVAMLMLLLVNFSVRMTNPRALDRRPGMWLWPRTALTDFTAYRSAEERRAHADITKATHRRNRHIAGVCLFGAVAVLAAEGVSRTFAALGVVMAGYAARAYFRGSTAHDRQACRRLDLYSVRIAWLLLAASLVTAAAILIADIPELREDRASMGWDTILRSLFYLVSLALLGRSLLHAGWYAENDRAEQAATAPAASEKDPAPARAAELEEEQDEEEQDEEDEPTPRLRDLLARRPPSCSRYFGGDDAPSSLRPIPLRCPNRRPPPLPESRPRFSRHFLRPRKDRRGALHSGSKKRSAAVVRTLRLGKRSAARYDAANRLIRGWMLVPLLAGAVPAAAGYMDSVDHDTSWSRNAPAIVVPYLWSSARRCSPGSTKPGFGSIRSRRT